MGQRNLLNAPLVVPDGRHVERCVARDRVHVLRERPPDPVERVRFVQDSPSFARCHQETSIDVPSFRVRDQSLAGCSHEDAQA